MGADEDHRRLLRGLLRLHRRPIAFEAPSLRAIADLPPATGSGLLVFDVPKEDRGWSERLSRALEERPGLRTLVLLPLDDPSLRSTATRAGARAILPSPFTSAEFFDAVDRLSAQEEPPAPHAVPSRSKARPRASRGRA